ncbi:hypothetical protein [Roseospirillum parvum]|uniref:Uncharacterized protein n=1 Tax=Roseospirillum parvum TaxID=83401 RepID=A0A1G7YL82_9PROT|nr:hypothetical protein [Roseospirillum parvum]SDG97154.1 hypothetical protein SAMN05421742_103337 [Roseospirillum parvum]
MSGNDLELTGLGLLWLGAVAYGLVLVLRNRHHNKAHHTGDPRTARTGGLEAGLLFVGTAGLLLGLGLFMLGALD